jgi:predicted AAA+ superfamily ATPase
VIPRLLETPLRTAAALQPVVVVTGPRQSGKTTLCRAVFGDRPYVSLEPLDERDFVRRDPRGFLRSIPDGAVIDEVQRVPELLSYLQERVDEDPRPGRFVLTGSQNLLLLETVTQTLAGRAALFELLPLSFEESLASGHVGADPFTVMLAGGYPAIHDRALDPAFWLADYLATYVERDVRQVLQVGDLLAFQTFLRLTAGRAGQLLNLANLGADAGISQPTARQWLSVLEATYVAWRLPPLHGNFRKRLVKTPKLYLHDTGLLCHLLGVRTPSELAVHPLRGAVFENWVVSEVVKWHRHRGLPSRLSFYRDRGGLEVDLIVQAGNTMRAVEIKSGATIGADFFAALEQFDRLLPGSARIVVHGGAAEQERSSGLALPWNRVHEMAWDEAVRATG